MPLSLFARDVHNISTPEYASRTRLRGVAAAWQNEFAGTTSPGQAPSANAGGALTRTRNVSASTRQQSSIANIPCSVHATARSSRIAGQFFAWAKRIVGANHVVCDESVHYNFNGWSVKVEWGDNALRFHDTDKVGGRR